LGGLLNIRWPRVEGCVGSAGLIGIVLIGLLFLALVGKVAVFFRDILFGP
jgi:hypothetical protein